MAATATPTATEVTATPPAGPPPLPGSIEVPSTAVLIDVRTGATTTVYRDTKQAAYSATFEGDEVVIKPGAVASHVGGGERAAPSRHESSPSGGGMSADVQRDPSSPTLRR